MRDLRPEKMGGWYVRIREVHGFESASEVTEGVTVHAEC